MNNSISFTRTQHSIAESLMPPRCRHILDIDKERRARAAVPPSFTTHTDDFSAFLGSATVQESWTSDRYLHRISWRRLHKPLPIAVMWAKRDEKRWWGERGWIDWFAVGSSSSSSQKRNFMQWSRNASHLRREPSHLCVTPSSCYRRVTATFSCLIQDLDSGRAVDILWPFPFPWTCLLPSPAFLPHLLLPLLIL